MGAFLDKPKTEKTNECGNGLGLEFSLASMQGWRVEMEDSHCTRVGLKDFPEWSFFAVFDGHAGSRVSMACSTRLITSILSSEQFIRLKTTTDLTCASSLQLIRDGLRQGFLSFDEELRRDPDLVAHEDKSGTTAVSALITPTHIFFANCGDSRAIFSRSGKCELQTEDHKPSNPIEKDRIQNAGGTVMIQRVNGSLAVSRALGDFEYKTVEGMSPIQQLVSPEPEIYDVRRDSATDEFLVIACDGIWDVMTNDQMVDFVCNRLQVHERSVDVCNSTLDTCLYKGSRDNMSMIIVKFAACPKYNSEKALQEKELDDKIRNIVKDLVLNQKAEIPTVIHHMELDEELKAMLPPGGGLDTKKAFVEHLYNDLSPNETAEIADLIEGDFVDSRARPHRAPTPRRKASFACQCSVWGKLTRKECTCGANQAKPPADVNATRTVEEPTPKIEEDGDKANDSARF